MPPAENMFYGGGDAGKPRIFMCAISILFILLLTGVIFKIKLAEKHCVPVPIFYPLFIPGNSRHYRVLCNLFLFAPLMRNVTLPLITGSHRIAFGKNANRVWFKFQ